MDFLVRHIRHARNYLRIPGARISGCESGTSAVEYALIGSLVSLSLVAGATIVGDTLKEYFQIVVDNF